MTSIPVKDMNGSDVGTFEVDLDQIGPPPNRQLLHDAVVMYEANRRVGTVRTKSRGMVEGSTAKLYRQKGTGRARAGARRTPVRRGGGHTFAKVPVDWGFRLPKKAIRQATRMAVRSKFEDDQVVLVDSLDFAAPKTAAFQQMLKALELAETSSLVVPVDYDKNVWLSGRNIAGVQVLPVSDLNAYDVLHQRILVLDRAAAERVSGQAAVAAAD